MSEPKEEKNLGLLICLTCSLVYESGTVCQKCGSTLVPQYSLADKKGPDTNPAPEVKAAPPEIDSSHKQPLVKPAQKLICPSCKILYERANSCIRCGSSLVREDASAPVEKVVPATKASEREKSPLPLMFESKTEVPPPLSTPEVKREVPKRVSRPEVRKDRPPPQTSEEHRQDRPSSDIPRKRGLPRKGLQKYLRLSFEIGGILIMVGAGGYLVWSIYSHYIVKRPEQSVPATKEVMSLPSGPALPTTPTGQIPDSAPTTYRTPSGEAHEIQNIRNLLEKIRQANLQKDINLFMSCYSNAFKERERKKKETLETWDQFNYLDLSYSFKKVEILAGTAQARIEWLVRFSPKAGGQPQESKTILDVDFQKEDSGWKIIEVKS